MSAPHASVLLQLGIAVVGITLLAAGLKNWRTYGVRSESAASMSPLPFRARFGSWATLVAINDLHRPWYVIARDLGPPEHLCRDILGHLRPERAQEDVVVLDVARSAAIPNRTSCQSSGAESGIRVTVLSYPPASISSTAAGFMEGGFVITDSEFVVLYGSSRLQDVAELGDILRLFELQSKAGSTQRARK